MEIAIIAGEVSGDVQAARLVNALKKIIPEIKIWGMGGANLKAEGVELLYDITQWSLIGFWEVVSNYRKIKDVFNAVLKAVSERRPKAVILVDYPGFNLRLAKEIKKTGIPVIYYISPQIWAWGRRRINVIKETVKRMIVIFPFEKEFYENYGVPVDFTGHPVLDVLDGYNNNRDALREEFGVSGAKRLIGILPGSREQEVKRHLPVLLQAAELIGNERFVIGAATPAIKDFTAKQAGKTPVYFNRTYDIMHASDLVLTSSGTATVETACFGTPMIVIYKLNWATFLCIKSMISLPNIAMVNVISGRRIVPEFVQADAAAENISREAVNILNNPDRIKEIREGLKSVRLKLGGKGAALRAAEAVKNCLYA